MKNILGFKEKGFATSHSKIIPKAFELEIEGWKNIKKIKSFKQLLKGEEEGWKEFKRFVKKRKTRKFGKKKLIYDKSYYKKSKAVSQQKDLIENGKLAKITKGKESETGKIVYRLWKK